MGDSSDSMVLLGAAKPVLATVMLVLLWIAEAIAPMFAGRPRRLQHDVANLALGAINIVVAAVLFGAALLTVTEWARQHNFGMLHWISLPDWLAWPLALILFDGWMYAWHRLNHRVPLLWRFHAVHHADRELNVTSAVRFHTGEIVLSSLARLLVLPLLGMRMPQLFVYEAVLLPVILFHHANVKVPARLDAALRCVITTPWMHWVHHSRWQPETDSNFASVLSIWDRIFGTFQLRSNPGDLELGLDEDVEEWQWRSAWGMLGRPFRAVTRRGDRDCDESG